MLRFGQLLLVAAFLCASRSGAALANDLIIDGTGILGPATLTLDGTTVRRYDNVCVINGGVIDVVAYAKGNDKRLYGNLELVAGSIFVDSSSTLTARAAGYRTPRCSNGDGLTSSAGGRGGCSVRDSGGGGAHFGPGGRGTIDRPMSFPNDFEDDCMQTYDGFGGCSAYPYCGVLGPSVAGVPVRHSIYATEFGASGGDKGCLDNDGYNTPTVAGAGGGRIALVGLAQHGSGASPCGLAPGTVRIEGTLDARGARGCGVDNDAAGGGAGGTVLLVGEQVELAASAVLTAAGGLGGDTRAAANNQPDYTDCPPGAQASSVACDDCGGGGGGGLISILSVVSDFHPTATFDVGGGLGGTCPLCQGEAGGGAGELQLDGAYVGEICDGFDNDWDDVVDEGFPSAQCGLGACATSVPTCSAGEPVACNPVVSADPSCKADADGGKPRVVVVLDTSASMLLDAAGYPTFGDGSVEHPGLDTDGDGSANDSRLHLAREALAQVMSAYPELDFALARYHQDSGVERSCQTAAWFECRGLVASYDDPRDNSGSVVCSVAYGPGPSDMMLVLADPSSAPNPSVREECINYAGSCGAPRRGADILSGFGTPSRDLVRWLDGRETAFDPSTTTGDVCLHSAGGDCEVRGSGPTPLAGSLQAVEDYLAPIRATDPVAACRDYSVVVVTDGVESCDGDPVAEAAHLHTLGIDVNVIAVSVLPSEQQALDDLALAGSGGTRHAAFVSQPQQLVPALTSIVARSVRFEACNGLDDDCDGETDEDFPLLGRGCDDGVNGICRDRGALMCNAAGDALACVITAPGQEPVVEFCNSLDDDCDGAIDEGLDCTDKSCVPSGSELCNGKDDDCDGEVDEADPSLNSACGLTQGECEPGVTRCVAGALRCVGPVPPAPEQCNGRDDDCNGGFDDGAVCPDDGACAAGACRRGCNLEEEFPCPLGMSCLPRTDGSGGYCLPSACAQCRPSERCEDQRCVDACEGVSCRAGLRCVDGDCLDCTALGCPEGEVCYDRTCQPDPCADVECAGDELCWNGKCLLECEEAGCRFGERCGTSGGCEPDDCLRVSCNLGSVCRGGRCVVDPCDALSCAPGDKCVSLVGCVADPCPVTRCPSGELCRIGAHGEPRCELPSDPNAAPPPVYVTSAGSGICSVALPGAPDESPGRGALAALLLLLGVALRARRRA